jgi:hypothetical protein
MLKLRTDAAAPWSTAEQEARADPADQKGTGQPADARQRHARGVEAHMSGEAAGHPEADSDRGLRSDQDQVVPGGWDRVDVDVRHEEHDPQRHHDAPEIKPPLVSLAQDDEDEDCVDEVIGDGHRAIIVLGRACVVGAGVDVRVDLSSTPG